MELKTIDFIKSNKNWKSILTQSPYHIKIDEDEDYMLLKYNQIDSNFNLEIVRECRGLIVDKHTLKPKALSFFKFFNVQEELAEDINWGNCRVQEKVDGSKLLVWWNDYKREWQLSTSGKLNAYEAPVNSFNTTFGDLFERALNRYLLIKKDLNLILQKEYCYTFELVAPETRIVIPYDKTNIYLLGIRDTNLFNEINIEVDSLCNIFDRPKEYQLNNLQECLDACDKMGYDEEGFVVVDNNWKRVKIKSPAYVAVHHLKDNGNVNKKSILELVEHNEQSEFLSYFPEYKNYVDDIEKKYKTFMKELKYSILDFCGNGFGSRKEAAIFILKNYPKQSSFIFNFINNYKDVDEFIKEEWDRLQPKKKLEYIGVKDDSSE